ncbi:MAG: peptide-methionine (S)-S-oxide reductase MsrA [Gammaproteobacteria bacterium]
MRLKILTFITSILALLTFTSNSFAATTTQPQTATAVFDGGCFWCMQADFDKVKGVINTTAGYTGGTVQNPTYEQVSDGGTGHFESVKVTYNPAVISYPQLLTFYWHQIDPTNADGQFCDIGQQYRAVIFYANDAQKQAALQSKQALLNSGQFKQITTLILPASTFYPAEDYHQEYYKKNPIRYNFYRYHCGRDQRLKQVWGTSN